jgi:leader peptidase (prepilin peptidase)/N-methyltransferase
VTATVLAFLFGLLIGSFLNVCIYRWPRDLSVVRPRSHCPSCAQIIAWYDNIPLLSYALLGARCRHCRARIPVRYPIVELVTGLAFSYFVMTLGPALPAVKMCVFAAALIALLFCDLEERILPDELTLGGAVVGLAFAAFVAMPDTTAQSLVWFAGVDLTGRADWLAESALGAALPAAILWGGGWLYEKVRHREGLGFGDVKFMLMVGAFLGLNGAFLTLMLGALAGSILGGGYMLLTRKDSFYELPFGTFLSAAALAVAIFFPHP